MRAYTHDDTLRLLETTSREAPEEQIAVPSGVKIAPLARRHGGFWETGVWRFPSPARKSDFEPDQAAANKYSRKANENLP